MISVSVKFYGYFSFFPIRQSKFNRIIPDTNRHDSIRARPDLHLTETFLFLYSNLYRRIKSCVKLTKLIVSRSPFELFQSFQIAV